MLFVVRILVFIIFVVLFIALAAMMTGLLGNNLKKNRNSRKLQDNNKNAR